METKTLGIAIGVILIIVVVVILLLYSTGSIGGKGSKYYYDVTAGDASTPDYQKAWQTWPFDMPNDPNFICQVVLTRGKYMQSTNPWGMIWQYRDATGKRVMYTLYNMPTKETMLNELDNQMAAGFCPDWPFADFIRWFRNHSGSLGEW
jgi:hypothetical protein